MDDKVIEPVDAPSVHMELTASTSVIVDGELIDDIRIAARPLHDQEFWRRTCGKGVDAYVHTGEADSHSLTEENFFNLCFEEALAISAAADVRVHSADSIAVDGLAPGT